MNPKISLYASSVRPHLWADFFRSLHTNKCAFEVVFAGNLTLEEVQKYSPDHEHVNDYDFRYIFTENIKPAQAYEVARRECKGDLVHWTADDAEYSDGLLDGIVEFWNSLNDQKAIITVQTIEDGRLYDLNDHRFFGGKQDTPLMAPLGVMSAKFLNDLGGTDRRYLCGQYENDIVMRACNAGARVHMLEYAGEICLDHSRKHGGNSGSFRTGYQWDRKVLEGAWAPEGVEKTVFGVAPFKRYDNGFEPFEDKDILTKSQGYSGMWS